MPAPTVLPGRTFQQVDPRSRLLFHWRANDLALTTVDRSSTGTFTRTSAGGMVEAWNGKLIGPAEDGLPRWEAVDVDSTRDMLALRMEGARTNFWDASEDLSDGAYVKNGVAVGANSTTICAPSGAYTADRVACDGSTDTEHSVERFGWSTGSTQHAFSCFVRAGAVAKFGIRTLESGGTDTTTKYNLTTGTIFSTGINHDPVDIEPAYNGFYRCSAVVTGYNSTASPRLRLHMLSTAGSVLFAGTTSDDLHLWGIQQEAGASFVTSYIPTNASAVTRAGEDVTWPFNADPQAMTAYVRFAEWGATLAPTGSRPRLFQIGSGSAPLFSMFWSASAQKFDILHNNSTDSREGNTGSTARPSYGDITELRGILNADGSVQIGQSINGAAEELGAATAAAPLQSAWSEAKIYVNNISPGTRPGFYGFMDLKFAPGVRSMQYMRESY